MRIEEVDQQSMPEDELRAIYELFAADERAALPDWEPWSWEQFRGEARTPPAWRPTVRWVARGEDGTVAGSVLLSLERRSTNRDHADVEVDVAAPFRRRGVGRALVHIAAERAQREGCATLDAACREAGPALPFAEATGFAAKQRERRSGLRFDRLDRSLLERWATPVPGYELVVFEDAYPDEWLERLANAVAVMNTAPLDDFEMEPVVFTVEELDEVQASRRATGTAWVLIAAVESKTGEIAGYTEVLFGPGRTVAEQEDTGVWPEHRNQGIGRWLKAAMLLHVLEARPSVRAVETWNAGSNDAMLHINVELGFEVLDWWWNLQGPIATVLERTA